MTRKSAEKRELQFIERLNKPFPSDLQEFASFLGEFLSFVEKKNAFFTPHEGFSKVPHEEY